LREIAQLPVRLRTASWLLRLYPRGIPGRTRIARLLLGEGLATRDVSIRGHDRLSFLVPSLREPIAFHLFIDGEYEHDTLALVLRILVPGGTFVDAGANIGVFALPAARRVGSQGRIVAIEASPTVFPYLEHNVEVNDVSNIVLRQCAVCNSDDGMVHFYEAPATSFGMGALAPQFNAEPLNVGTRTLDSLLREMGIMSVDVLKVDVEGFEAAVFRGAERLLTGPNPPVVLFEFCDWAEQRSGHGLGDAQRILTGYGYTLWRLNHFPGGTPLGSVVAEGCDMLVAARGVDDVRGMTAFGCD
jgi:FkbM family methyltransferase